MQDADLYFTQTIVGAPMTLPLGRPLRRAARHAAALEIDPRTGHAALTPGWQEWLDAHTQTEAPAGAAWRRPGALRRFLVRRTVLVSASGWLVAALLAAALAWPQLQALVLRAQGGPG
jgi:hypothetical protein